MALVASIYKSSSDKIFPDVLLLDEVDASLHPTMIKNMLNTIEKIFLTRGVKIILVSHSPTTIALAPEESIFLMNKSGLNRVEKKSKSEALSILTQGYATIDEGLKLFDEVAKNEITIITEGENSSFLEKMLELYKINDVEVIKGLESMSGKNQLSTLFEFFSKTNHSKKVLFVWDCDVKLKLNSENNTFPFVLPKQDNFIAKKEIENMFPKDLLDDFCNKVEKSRGEKYTTFNKDRKKDFKNHILSRSKKEDFVNFSCLIDKLDEVRNS